jgi:hypothetical protein
MRRSPLDGPRRGGPPPGVSLLAAEQPVALGDGVFVGGDHRDTAAAQGAMSSGGRTAPAVLEHLRRARRP